MSASIIPLPAPPSPKTSPTPCSSASTGSPTSTTPSPNDSQHSKPPERYAADSSPEVPLVHHKKHSPAGAKRHADARSHLDEEDGCRATSGSDRHTNIRSSFVSVPIP